MNFQIFSRPEIKKQKDMNNQFFKKSTFLLASLFLVAFLIVPGLVLAQVPWVGPTSNPPDGNPSGFLLNTLLQPGDFIFPGNITIGNLTVDNGAEISGGLSVFGSLCLNFADGADCISDWEEITGGVTADSLWIDPIGYNFIFNANSSYDLSNQAPHVRVTDDGAMQSRTGNRYVEVKAQEGASDVMLQWGDESPTGYPLKFSYFRGDGDSLNKNILYVNPSGSISVGQVNTNSNIPILAAGSKPSADFEIRVRNSSSSGRASLTAMNNDNVSLSVTKLGSSVGSFLGLSSTNGAGVIVNKAGAEQDVDGFSPLIFAQEFDGTNVEVMRITGDDSNGNGGNDIGIGTTAPGGKLGVVSNDGGVAIHGVENGLNAGSKGVGILGQGRKGLVGKSTYFNESTGIRGIAVEGDAYKTSLFGEDGPSDAWAGYFHNSNPGVFIEKLCLGDETSCQTSWDDVVPVSLWSESGNNIYRDVGDVGIGSSGTPAQKLDVTGNVRADGFCLGSDPNNCKSTWEDVVDLDGFGLWIDPDGDPTPDPDAGNYVYSNNTLFDPDTNNQVPHARIMDSGAMQSRVGSRYLELKANGGASDSIIQWGDENPIPQSLRFSYFRSNLNPVNNSDIFFVNPNGTISIGQSNNDDTTAILSVDNKPGEKYQTQVVNTSPTGWANTLVQNDLGKYLSLTKIGSANTNVFGNNIPNAGVIWNGGSNEGKDPLVFIQGGGGSNFEAMRIAENGNIGIGRNNPQYKLDVSADINAKYLCINGDCKGSWSEVGGSDGYIGSAGDHVAGGNLSMSNYSIDDLVYWNSTGIAQIRIDSDDNTGNASFRINNGENDIVLKVDETGAMDIEGNLSIGANGYLDDDAGPVGGAADDWLKFDGHIELHSNNDNATILLRDKDNNGYSSLGNRDGTTYFASNNSMLNYFIKGDNGRNAYIGNNLKVEGNSLTVNNIEVCLENGTNCPSASGSDGYIGSGGDHTASGILNMSSNKITNLGNPTNLLDAANKEYVDSKITPEFYIGTAIAGGVHWAVGDLNMNNGKIYGLPYPASDTDAANKQYVDDRIATVLGGAADGYIGASETHTSGGDLNMGGYDISNVDFVGANNIGIGVSPITGIGLLIETPSAGINARALNPGGVSIYASAPESGTAISGGGSSSNSIGINSVVSGLGSTAINASAIGSATQAGYFSGNVNVTGILDANTISAFNKIEIGSIVLQNGDIAAPNNSRSNCDWTEWETTGVICPDGMFAAGFDSANGLAYAQERVYCCEL